MAATAALGLYLSDGAINTKKGNQYHDCTSNVNIIVSEDYEMANFIARATYGSSSFAVDCLQYHCCIGDRYIDGTFYHTKENGENTPVEYVPTEAQAIEMLTSEMTVMNEYLVELDYQTAILSLGL